MNFNPEDIKQGRTNQAASQETPESFATIDGAAAPRETGNLDQSSRMAGQMGARALAMINNPVHRTGWEGLDYLIKVCSGIKLK